MFLLDTFIQDGNDGSRKSYYFCVGFISCWIHFMGVGTALEMANDGGGRNVMDKEEQMARMIKVYHSRSSRAD